MRKRTFQRNCLRLLFILAVSGLTLQCSEENPLAPDVRGRYEVWITANGFEPATLTVPAGTTVIWSNKDNTIHIVNSGIPDHPDELFPQSPTIRPNDSHSYKFVIKGTYDYYCTITRAIGKIVVN